MDWQQIGDFKQVRAQLDSLYTEIGALSKKTPNSAVNRFKLTFVNVVLRQANDLLGNEYRPFEEFELFDEDELPTNSDVLMILSQYLNSLERLRSNNIKRSGARWYWLVDGEVSDMETMPRKLSF